MNKLIPLSNYVLEQLEKVNNGEISNVSLRKNLDYYTNFLHQKLNDRYEINGVSAHPLNRFIPCDLEGNILEQPSEQQQKDDLGNWDDVCNSITNQYKEAKDRVLFKGFYVNKHNTTKTQSICYENIFHVYWKFNSEWCLSKGLSTIQDLCKYNLPLTETTLKNYKHD